MIKRRYDAKTGKLGKAYPDYMRIPEPYLTLSNEENDKISSDDKNIYFYLNGQLVAKDKAAEEAKEKRIAEIKEELNQIDLKSIRAVRAGETEYLKRYEEEAVELRKKLAELE